MKVKQALYDEKTKLWCNGPSYIAEVYMEELKQREIDKWEDKKRIVVLMFEKSVNAMIRFLF